MRSKRQPSPAQDDDLRNGRLEQMCPVCGRWEAAHAYCSWCLRPMSEADWYRNGDTEQRKARMPKTPPANPPSEYTRSDQNWPEAWGTCPIQRAPRNATTPLKRSRRTVA